MSSAERTSDPSVTHQRTPSPSLSVPMSVTPGPNGKSPLVEVEGLSDDEDVVEHANQSPPAPLTPPPPPPSTDAVYSARLNTWGPAPPVVRPAVQRGEAAQSVESKAAKQSGGQGDEAMAEAEAEATGADVTVAAGGEVEGGTEEESGAETADDEAEEQDEEDEGKGQEEVDDNEDGLVENDEDEDGLEEDEENMEEQKDDEELEDDDVVENEERTRMAREQQQQAGEGAAKRARCRHTVGPDGESCCHWATTEGGGNGAEWESTKPDAARAQNKHEESARFHSCMSAGSAKFCSGMEEFGNNKRRDRSVLTRLGKKRRDADSGYQLLGGNMVRSHQGGILMPNQKQRIIRDFGLNTMQDYDLTPEELLYRQEVVHMMSRNGWDYQRAQDELGIVDGRLPDGPPPPRHATASSLFTSSLPMSSARLTVPLTRLPLSRTGNSPVTHRRVIRALDPPYLLTAAEIDMGHHEKALGSRMEGEVMFIPLPLTESARQKVLNSTSGAVVFTPLRSHWPQNADRRELRMENRHLYTTVAARGEQMQLAMLGVDGSEIARELFPEHAENALSEVEMYEAAEDATDGTRQAKVTWYAKDLEWKTQVYDTWTTSDGKKMDGFSEPARMGLFGANWGGIRSDWRSDGDNIQQPVMKDIRANMATLSAGHKVFARIALTQKPHPLNPHLINCHPRSLLSILVLWAEKKIKALQDRSEVEVDWVNAKATDRWVVKKQKSGGKTTTLFLEPERALKLKRQKFGPILDNIAFPGFMSPMMYVKNDGNFFRGHLEQLAAPSINRCDSGAQYWITIPFTEGPKLLNVFEVLLRRSGHVKDGTPLTDDEYALLPIMLLSRQLFIPPWLLDECGVRYSHHYQKEGDVMIVEGHTLHQGVVDNVQGHSHAEAVNFMDVHWLAEDNGGLRVVFEVCKWLRTTYSLLWHSDERHVRSSLSHLFFKTYHAGIIHFMQCDFAVPLFQLLHNDLVRHYNNNPAVRPLLQYDPDVLTKAQAKVAIRRLAYCIATLQLPEVDLLFADHAKDRHQYRSGLVDTAAADAAAAPDAAAAADEEPKSSPKRGWKSQAAEEESENDIDEWPVSIFTVASRTTSDLPVTPKKSLVSGRAKSTKKAVGKGGGRGKGGGAVSAAPRGRRGGNRGGGGERSRSQSKKRTRAATEPSAELATGEEEETEKAEVEQKRKLDSNRHAPVSHRSTDSSTGAAAAVSAPSTHRHTRHTAMTSHHPLPLTLLSHSLMRCVGCVALRCR